MEIIAARILPLFILMMGIVLMLLWLITQLFSVPVRGSLVSFLLACALCSLCGIGIGALISTLARSSQQAQLMSFFVIPILAMFSGALTPIEALPDWIQPFTLLNPLRHFSAISRGVLIKGIGMEVLYPNFLSLLLFATALVSVSVWRFRKQLS